MSQNIQIILPDGEIIIAKSIMGSIIPVEQEDEDTLHVQTLVAGRMTIKDLMYLHRSVVENGAEAVKQAAQETAEQTGSPVMEVLADAMSDILAGELVDGLFEKTDEAVREAIKNGEDNGCECPRCTKIREEVQGK